MFFAWQLLVDGPVGISRYNLFIGLEEEYIDI